MITEKEVLQILDRYTDVAYEQDGEIKSIVIRKPEFYKIAREIIKKAKDNARHNIRLISDITGETWNNGEFYK